MPGILETGQLVPPVARTSRSAWIEAGLAALAGGGPEAVRVEALAVDLGVTKGGFYGQFADRGTFLDALLDEWERRSVAHVVASIQDGTGGPDAIRLAGARTFAPALRPIELAVRRWARSDPRAAERLRAVDHQRLTYLRTQFATFVADPAEVEARSTLALLMMLGQLLLDAEDDEVASAVSLAGRWLLQP